MASPPGWHPDSRVPGQERYWDGTAWTDQVRPAPKKAAAWWKATPFVAAIAMVLGIGIGVAIGAAAAGGDDEPASSSSSSTDETDEEPQPAEDEVTPDPEPAAAEASPDGEYQAGCDYLLEPYKFTADASIENTGNIGATYQLQVEWYLAGGKSIKATKKVMIRAGDTKRIGIERPATMNEIDSHQTYSGGDSCKAEVEIVDTFGAVE